MKRNPAAWMLAALLAGSFSDDVIADCGGTRQCIGIGTTIEAARNGHSVPTVAMPFGNVQVAAASTQTLFVAAVTGPPGERVTLNAVVLDGPDSNQFSFAGGNCPRNGGDGPVHGDNERDACTIVVRFTPTSPGPKQATLSVRVTPSSPGNIDRRTAALTGIGGSGRISPALEANVAPLIASQVAAQRRFAAAQVSNISNRLDSLHRVPGLRATGQPFAVNAPDRQGPLLPPGRDGATDALPSMRYPQPGRGDMVAGSRSDVGEFTNLLVSALRSRQLPLMLASDAGTLPGAISDGGYWFSGIASFGRIGATDSQTRFETSGFTVGADRRVGPGLIIGGAAGYGRAQDAFEANGAEGRHDGQSLSLYGSYRLQPDLQLDAILGYGTTDSRSSRFVVASATRASSERNGSQYFGSLAISKQMHRENLSWAPYARYEFNRGTLDRTDETGAGIGSLTYLEQRHRSSRLLLGVRASSMHEMAYGRVVPHLRLEYGRELQRVGSATVAYADQPAGLTYSVDPRHERRNMLLLGFGAEFLTDAGITLGFDIGTNGRYANDPEYTTRFWLSSALGVVRPAPSTAAAAPRKRLFNLTAGLRLDDNITRTGEPTPTLSDRIWTAGIGFADRVEFSDSLNLGYSAQLAAEKFQTHDRLDASTMGARAELAYQAGGLFTSPRFGVFGSAAYDDSRSNLRTGHRLEVGLNARVQVAERTGITGVLAHNRRRTRGDIFDTDFNAARIGADQQIGERGVLRAGLEYRRGDFVSSGIPAEDSAAISEALADDDAFPVRRFVAYRFPARSLIASFGYGLSLGSRDSIDFGVSAIHVRPTQEPDYGRFVPYPSALKPGQGGKSPYSVRQLEIAYTMRF